MTPKIINFWWIKKLKAEKRGDYEKRARLETLE
jgi:hypothetical protein